MARKKAATEDDIKAASVEPAKQSQSEENNEKQDEPISLSGPGPVAQPAQKDVKDTPVVDIEHKDGEVVAVERHANGDEFKRLANDDLVKVDNVDKVDKVEKTDEPKADEAPAPAQPELSPEDLKAKVADLEKEVSDLKATVKAFEDHSKADKEEIDRLHREILESDAEGLRAQLEVVKRENEVLMGSVAAPNKVYFG